MTAIYLGDHRVLAKTKYGHKIYLDSRDLGIAPHIMLDGEWENWVGEAMSRYLPRSYFFDIGANVGWFSLLAMHFKASRVFAFEPSPATFKLLKDTVQVNGLQDRVLCFPKALSDEDNVEGTLHLLTEYPGSSSMHRIPLSEQKMVTVSQRTLDALMSEWIPDVDWNPKTYRVFKIDVEGFEPKVVHGARKLIEARETVALFVEYNSYSGQDQIQQMVDFLLGVGFVLGVVEHTGEIRNIAVRELSSLPDASMLLFRRFA